MTSPKGGEGGEERRLARKGIGGSDACTGIYGGRKRGATRGEEYWEKMHCKVRVVPCAQSCCIYVRTKWYLHHERVYGRSACSVRSGLTDSEGRGWVIRA